MSAVLGSREAMQRPEEVFRTGQNHKRERGVCKLVFEGEMGYIGRFCTAGDGDG